MQVAGPVPRLELALVDVSGETDPEAAVTRTAEEELRRPFDLAGAPPLRARFLRAGPRVPEAAAALAALFHPEAPPG